jgi:hypothetical protein
LVPEEQFWPSGRVVAGSLFSSSKSRFLKRSARHAERLVEVEGNAD